MGDIVVVQDDPAPDPAPEPVVVVPPAPDPAASIVHADLLALREEVTGRLDKHEERLTGHEGVHADHSARMDRIQEQINAVPEPEPEPEPEPAPAVIDDPPVEEVEEEHWFFKIFRGLR